MKYEIGICTPGMAFNGETVSTQSLGGSETAAYYVARELARRGHRVTAFTNTDKPGPFEGVLYRTIQEFEPWAKYYPHDVLIGQRQPNLMSFHSASKVKVLWCHDLPHAALRDQFTSCLWGVDKVAVVSRFMQDRYMSVYGISEKFFHIAENAVDLDLVRSIGEPLQRDPFALLYIARPERGLDKLVREVFPLLLQKDSRYTLHLAGYDNPVEHLADFYAELAALCQQLGDRAIAHGHLSKPDLYRLMKTCGAYVYPQPSEVMQDFKEVSCIAAMEARACGLPFIGMQRGALPETLKDNPGTVLLPEPFDAEAFADAVHETCTGNQIFDNPWQPAWGRDWAHVADAWEEMLDRTFYEKTRTDDPCTARRLLYHFSRLSDVAAVRKLKSRVSESERQLADDLLAPYAFAFSQETAAEYYLKQGERQRNGFLNKRLKAGMFGKDFLAQTQESRFIEVHEMLRQLTEQGQEVYVLDYGCGHGWCALFLALNNPNLRIIGYDLDPGACAFANTLATQVGVIDRVSFVHERNVLEREAAKVTYVLLMDVIEHMVDPWTELDDVERMVPENTPVLVTTPFGPVEYASDNWQHGRQHLWHFELDDIRDVFNRKPGYGTQATPEGANPYLYTLVGYYKTIYRTDRQPYGGIDWERKLAKQAPRETLSVQIIGGANIEQTLLWCLEPWRWVADEILVGNTGGNMSELAKQIVFSFPQAMILDVPDPRTDGFDEARNAVLGAGKADWVFWVDTDEKCVGACHVSKYLRTNIFEGYAVHQHHFSVDHSHNPDLPVRLFRADAGMRFFGSVHEHPEKGLNNPPHCCISLQDVNIMHVGYESEAARQQRFNRNLPLLEMSFRKYPDRLLNYHFFCRDNMLMVKFLIEQNGGRIDAECKRRAQEVVECYHKHFLGKPRKLFRIDTEQYYHHACAVLQGQWRAVVDIRVDRSGVGTVGDDPRAKQYMSLDDIRGEVFSQLSTITNHLTKDGWHG